MPPDVQDLVKTNVAESIDPAITSDILSSPPFIQIDGLFNARDVSDGTHPALRKGFLFRSGSLENITNRGMDELKALGVQTIIDLRSAKEVLAFPEPNIEGIEFVAARTETDPMESVNFGSVVESYTAMLETHKDIWKKVLEHVRDSPEKPLLLHCTAGKDRTAVAVALILGVAGLPSSYISSEYALTRIGIEPVREFLLGKLQGGRAVDFTSERFQALTRMDPEVINEFLMQVAERFGGAEEYVVQVLGFEKTDIELMQQNLRVVQAFSEP